MSASFPLAKLTFLIAILTAVGQLTQTMYVPSIGYMAGEFSVSASTLQAVMACYLIPYGFSQFIYGPLSDRIGRKPIIIVGLLIYVVGTLIALFAHQYEWFLAGSFVQGLGIGCGGAMSRTLTRDCFEGTELHRANSLISMCVIFSPLIAPVLGGFLTEEFGWRSSYLFLSLFAIAVTITMMTSMVETLPKEKRQVESVTKSYRFVLADKRFQGFLLVLVATFSGVAVFEAAAGVLLGGVLGLPATTVSILFVLPIPGYLVGAGLSSYLAQRYSERLSLNVGLGAIFVGSAIVLAPGLIEATSAAALVGGATLYFLGAGILFPAATTGALSPFPLHAGTGGAILGGMQNLGAGLVTLLASMFPTQDQLPLGCLMMAMSLVVLFGLRWIQRQQVQTNQAALTI
ncbi:multidrug efflux MFS transporter EmrD [Vibrio sagamiensis]|uniref:Bcr/CflA family efflux transporter n=1 Tax=Vibrio sagamiensis NBRC 104589 TaxID=1219064 RepID=A0A511QD69_9VIBR|nr:multidrug efflux MFS transporter EmrD [Vibrio sagamiensis]PNQ68866.1 multidrug transporter EmrD [Vibrio agarivorans]GEM75251.1 Bcr/CflA family drug resistance efflux transporter [Vibrio sagamiensis NBRC 104589]